VDDAGVVVEECVFATADADGTEYGTGHLSSKVTASAPSGWVRRRGSMRGAPGGLTRAGPRHTETRQLPSPLPVGYLRVHREEVAL
jgi:hypothetical protein